MKTFIQTCMIKDCTKPVEDYSDSGHVLLRGRTVRYPDLCSSHIDLASKYMLDQETVVNLFDKDCCPICRAHFSIRHGAVIDVDQAGKLRDVICRPCRDLLNIAGDSTRILQSAVAYLEAKSI